MLRSLIAIFSLSCLSVFGLAQNSKLQDQMPLNKLVLKQWTVDDGLISNNLTSVDQTKDGFIWIATFNGIHRFDGINFKLYDKENVDFLMTNAFYGVIDGQDGAILYSQGSGLVKYDQGELSPMSGFNVSSVRTVMLDSKGRYWCGTNNEGLVVKSGDKIEKAAFSAFDHVVILNIYEDSKGRIWVVTDGNGLVLYEDGKYRLFEAENLPKQNIVTSVLETNDGVMVLGTLAGIYTLDQSLTKAQGIKNQPNIYVNDLIEDSYGLVWVATERGLYRVDIETGEFEVFDQSNGLPANQISSIMMDHEKSIWLSTKKSGLIRMNVGSLETLGVEDGITSTRINIVEEHNGRQYVGSDDGSIFVRDGEKFRELPLSTKRRQVGIRDFMFDGNTVYVASYLGLHKYENGRETLMTTANGLSANTIRRALKASDGTVWLASRTGGVIKIKGGKVTEIYNANNGLSANFILALEEDREGNIVVGTHSGGISIISQDSVETHIPEVGGLVIFNVYVDELNRYWLSTSVGVFVFNEGSFRKMEFDAKFKTEAIFDIVADNQGSYWLSSNNGITQISKEQAFEFADGRRTSVEGVIFDSNDGMTIRECTGATRSTLLSDGTVWVPTIDGVAVVDPQNIQFNDQIPNVSITAFVVDEELVSRKNTEIEPGKLRYEFEFASTSYLASDRVRFRYKLSGVDEDWTETSEHRIEYTNLAPGKYTFSVIGSNNSDIWNEDGDGLTFSVEPFYYQTAGFRIIIGAFILLVFYFIFVWRVRRVKAINAELSKVNEELDRFVYSASHDIRAPLTSILGAATIAKLQDNKEEKDASLKMIEESAKKLDGFIRDIIDYSRNQRLELVPEKIDLASEIDSIIESLKYLDDVGQVKCYVECNQSHFTSDVRRLRVILKNIIANAFLYKDQSKEESYVRIDCKADTEKLVIVISDNGLGMKKEILDHIFTMFYRGTTDSKGSGLGLYIAKENMDKMGGTIEVSSVLKEGTTFIVTIPAL